MIIGTLAALYLVLEAGFDLFREHPTWMYREGLMRKIVIVLLYADTLLLFIAGFIGAISFFIKGHIWKPVTKGIIINIILWFVSAGLILFTFAF